MEQALIRLADLSKYYTSGQNVVMGLNHLDLTFHRGEFVAITGESGSGKSTLSHVLGGIIPYESGEFYFDGQPTSHYDSLDWERYRRDHISFISQNYGILPGATVLSNVVTALRLSGMETRCAKTSAEEILRQVDLWQLRHRRAAKLSSGQKQRLSIARALAKPAPILIADEPTGNLDPENSRKVIELLAQAAKDRLVLLVTHEFSEAEGVATRHIALQDGRIVMDAPLRAAADPGPRPAVTTKSNAPISPFVALLQQRSRPVWSTLMTLFFSITAFAVFAFLGTFIIALDDTDTRIYDLNAFTNGDPQRIIISTLDKRPLTQADYETILRNPYAVSLETNGYLTDVQYSYRDGVDYKTIHTEHVNPGTGEHYMEVSFRPYRNSPFLKSIPLLAEGTFPLLEGTLPQNFYEVVAHTSGNFSLGQQITVFLSNSKYWGMYQYVRFQFTVVGITDYGEGLYFHNDVGRLCQQIVHTDNAFAWIPEDNAATAARFEQFLQMTEGTDAVIPEDYSPYLTDDQVRCHPNVYITLYNPKTGETVPFRASNINLEDPESKENQVILNFPKTLSVSGTTADGKRTTLEFPNHLTHISNTRISEVSQNTFDKLTWQPNSEQVSLTIEDYAYTDRVLEALHAKGYVAASPYQLGSTRVDAAKAEQRRQTLTVCISALLAVIALQVVLLRALFSVQTESYKLMSNIGLVSRSAALSVLWQILGFTALGQLLGGCAIWVCGNGGIERIAHILRYLPPKYVVILSGVHLAASVAAALWVMRVLKKQVYPLADSFSDIRLDTDKEA